MDKSKEQQLKSESKCDVVVSSCAGAGTGATGTLTEIWVQVLQLRRTSRGQRSTLWSHVVSVCSCFLPHSSLPHCVFAEKAREYLHKTGRFIVIGGIISPVHDSYGKPVSDAELSLCGG